ncbi:hypothetical protein ACJX0J_018161 [Zea mays]
MAQHYSDLRLELHLFGNLQQHGYKSTTQDNCGKFSFGSGEGTLVHYEDDIIGDSQSLIFMVVNSNEIYYMYVWVKSAATEERDGGSDGGRHICGNIFLIIQTNL